MSARPQQDNGVVIMFNVHSHMDDPCLNAMKELKGHNWHSIVSKHSQNIELSKYRCIKAMLGLC